MAYKGYTEARAKANAKYAASRWRVGLYFEPEQRPEIEAAANAAGLTVGAYCKLALAEKMERDKVATE